MIFSRSEPRPVVMTWITVCIHVGSAGNHLFCNVCLALACSRRPVGAEARIRALRTAKRLQQRAIHHVNIDVSFVGMTKGTRQRADNIEAEVLP